MLMNRIIFKTAEPKSYDAQPAEKLKPDLGNPIDFHVLSADFKSLF
jgi:hypothetical protein